MSGCGLKHVRMFRLFRLRRQSDLHNRKSLTMGVFWIGKSSGGEAIPVAGRVWLFMTRRSQSLPTGIKSLFLPAGLHESQFLQIRTNGLKRRGRNPGEI